MKNLLVLAAAVVGAYYLFVYFQNPSEIRNPMYAELRVDITAGTRQLDLVLFARMSDETDCRTRTEKAWEKIITGCKECSMRLVDCKPELLPRYSRLFDDEPINIAYLSFKRGSRFERDGRMVIWGITGEEGDKLCEMLRPNMQKRYSGKVTCVGARK